MNTRFYCLAVRSSHTEIHPIAAHPFATVDVAPGGYLFMSARASRMAVLVMPNTPP